MDKYLRNLQERLQTAQYGEIYYRVDVTRIFEFSAAHELKIDRVGREYATFFGKLRCRFAITNQLGHEKDDNYTINRKDYVFASLTDANEFLEEAKAKNAAKVSFQQNCMQHDTMYRSCREWSPEKWANVLAAMKDE